MSLNPQKVKYRRGLLLERQGGRCFYCDQTLSVPPAGECNHTNGPDTATLDHIIPRSQGGSNEIRNLVLACLSCNGARGDEGMLEFLVRSHRGPKAAEA
jgi:5-methylcytosine-specific restriction endonuclease McrA